MERRATRIRTTLALSMLALTLIAPWALAWYNLAAAQGNEVARKNKDNLRTRMTPDQIARAQELSATLFDRIN